MAMKGELLTIATKPGVDGEGNIQRTAFKATQRVNITAHDKFKVECYVFIWKWELKEFQGFLGLLDLLILILMNRS